MSITIRDAKPEDVATIVEFNQRLALETESRRIASDVLRPGGEAALRKPEYCRYFIAEIDGEFVGQTMITYEWSDWRNGVFWWIQSVYVRADFRKRGVFRALHEHIESLAKSTPGVCGIRLYVEADNSRAIATYRRLGLAPTGHLVHEQDWSGAVKPVDQTEQSS